MFCSSLTFGIFLAPSLPCYSETAPKQWLYKVVSEVSDALLLFYRMERSMFHSLVFMGGQVLLVGGLLRGWI